MGDGFDIVYSTPRRGTSLLEILYWNHHDTAVIREEEETSDRDSSSRFSNGRRLRKLLSKGYRVVSTGYTHQDLPEDYFGAR